MGTRCRGLGEILARLTGLVRGQIATRFQITERIRSIPQIVGFGARSSCVALEPRHGKCGDRIQRKSGIMTIRVMVMELGRFIETSPHCPFSGGLTALLQ